jgi:hypothetical protein
MEQAFGLTGFQHSARFFKINMNTRPGSLQRFESRPGTAPAPAAVERNTRNAAAVCAMSQAEKLDTSQL